MIFLSACATKAQVDKNIDSSPNTSLSYIQKAYEALGVDQVQFEFNETKDFVLSSYTEYSEVPATEPLRVAVIRLSDNKVIYRENINNGNVKWVNDYTVELISPPGIPNGNQATLADYTYYLDVKTGKKTQKTTSQK